MENMDLLPSKTLTVTLPIDLFNCPVCLDLPPITNDKIYQCKNGHLRCQQCEEKLRLSQSPNKCPTCRCSMHDHELIRNVVVEKALEYVEAPCPFESAGCSVRQPRRMLIKHSEECLFRSVRLCGLLGFKDCSFDAFNSHGLIEHMKTSHHIPHNSNEFTSYDYNFGMSGSSSPSGGNGSAPQIIKTVMCAHFRLFPMESRPFFIHVLKPDEQSDGYYFLCLFVGPNGEDSKRFFASYYLSGTDSRKSVVSWPTVWYKHVIRNKEANRNIMEEKDVCDYGFRLSRTMLKRIQGDAKTANIFVHIRERGEEHSCSSFQYESRWQSSRNESSSESSSTISSS